MVDRDHRFACDNCGALAEPFDLANTGLEPLDFILCGSARNAIAIMAAGFAQCDKDIDVGFPEAACLSLIALNALAGTLYALCLRACFTTGC